MLIRGSAGMRLTLDFLSGSGPYDYIYRFSRDGRAYEMANCYKNTCRYLMSMEQGEAELDQEWRESSSVHSRLIVSGEAGFLLVLGMFVVFPQDAQLALNESPIIGSAVIIVTSFSDPFIGMVVGVALKFGLPLLGVTV